MDMDFSEILADGIVHIKGTLFEIAPKAINIAEKPSENEELGKYTWSNPRYLTADEEHLGNGFEKTDMQKLRESIRETGLHNPLVCRWIMQDGKKTVQLVDGQRRFMVVELFIRKNEKVYDQYTKMMVGAKELYSSVLCRVYDAPDDKTALKLSWQENKCRVDFGEEANVKLVQKARAVGWSDEDILDITGNKPDWLRDIDHIINKLSDDSETMKAIHDGSLSLEAAAIFADIESKEVRHEALQTATEYAGMDYKKRIGKLEKEILRAKEVREIAQAEKVEAEMTGNEERVELAAEKEEKATKKVKQKLEEKAEQETKTAVTKRAAVRAVREVDLTVVKPPTALRYKQIDKLYVTPLEEAITNNGHDNVGEYIAHPDILRALLLISRGIMDGEEDAMSLFKKCGARLKTLLKDE